jgi:hypothetical protein
MANRKLLPQSEPRLSGILSVLLTDSATTAVFNNPPDESELPTYFLLEPDSDDNREKVRAVDVAGNNVTIERGVDNGGVGVEHQANSTYKQTFTAQHWDKVVEALEQGWLSEDSGLVITKVNDTTLRIAGYDRTTYYPTGRVLLINNTVKCKVVSVSYGGGNTDVVISGGTVPTTITSLKLILGPVENPLVGINEIPRYGEDAEVSDDYEITLNPAPSAYFAGMMIAFKATTVNTGACTLNVNSLGAKAIKTPEGTDLTDAQIPTGSVVTVIYDGTSFILQSIGGLATKDYVDNNIPTVSHSLYEQAIINGACQINQIVTAVNLTTGKLYGTDTFYAKGAGTAVSAGTISNTASPALTTAFADKLAGVTLTGTGIVYGYRFIESANAKHYKNKTASFSVLVRHDVGSAKNYTIKINKANSADNFSAVTNIATGDAVSVETGTDTLLKLENVSMGDCSNGIEIEIIAECGAITTKNFEFSEWKFNLGSVVLSFMAKGYEGDLIDCQRYLQVIKSLIVEVIALGTASSTTIAQVLLNLKQTMRIVPTLIATAADFQLYDGVNIGVAVTTIRKSTINNSGGLVFALELIVASGLTQYRPYFLIFGSADKFLILNARPTIA